MTGALPLTMPVTAARVRLARIHGRILAQVALCVFPPMGAVALGHPLLGARYIVGMLFLLLGFHMVGKRRHEFVALAVGVLPVLILLRGLFFYNSLIAVLGLGLLLWFSIAPADFGSLYHDPPWQLMVAASTLYWWISVVRTGQYATNMRVFELVLTATSVWLLARHRSYLATALFGVALSTTALALGLLPYGDRLGMAEIDNQRLGNPVLLGLPAALILLLAFADQGRWLLLERRRVLRLVVLLTAGEWLVLSASRGSWVVGLAGMAVLFTLSRADRGPLLGAIVVFALVTAPVLLTKRGAQAAEHFEKTVDPERTLVNRTSGRSAQWAALPSAFAGSPIWGWGPGSAKDVVASYSGRHLIFHSLYLQIAAETGSIGSLVLLLILIPLIRRALAHHRQYGEIVPLLGITGFLAVGISVTAMDCVSGIFFGLGMLGRDPIPRYTIRKARLSAATED